jgi:hypothetical protein
MTSWCGWAAYPRKALIWGMQRIRSWDGATLNDHVTSWFLNN